MHPEHEHTNRVLGGCLLKDDDDENEEGEAELQTLFKLNSWEESRSLLCSFTVMLPATASPSAAMTTHSATTNNSVFEC